MKTRAFTITATPLGDRRVKFVASTPAVDSHGTRLHPRGCKLDRFRVAGSLPFLWAHRREGEPDDVLGRVVDVEVSEDSVVCVVEFDDHPKALRCLRQVRRGFLMACSVGFVTEQEELAADGVVDVLAWQLCELSLCPIGSNPEALAVRGFTLRNNTSRPDAARASGATSQAAGGVPHPNPKRGLCMNLSEILAKLGLKEGAKADEIVDALIKYMAAGPDAAEAKALLTGLLAMLAPSSSSASDGGAAEAAQAMAEEVERLRARVAELEGQKAEAEKKAEPTAEERADQAIRDGRWLGSQRSALVEQYKAGKTPFLFAPKTFSSRGVTFTEGGNPVKPDAKARLDVGADGAGTLSELERGIVDMAARSKLPISTKTFAAAKGR
jgi:HK97 family phage prohead protease